MSENKRYIIEKEKTGVQHWQLGDHEILTNQMRFEVEAKILRCIKNNRKTSKTSV